MKAYTDIKQSAQLALLLPIESADMKYPYFGDGQYGTTALFGEPIEFSGDKDVPCWSLAALLSVLEHTRCFQGDKPTYCFCECFGKDKLYHEVEADNFVDACYEMILKLHEQKLL